MNEPAITPEVIASHGLSPDEYQRMSTSWDVLLGPHLRPTSEAPG